ncbi:MAG: type II toxin-antitoxin system VapB family antitoxin [Deltaproteobacteria bacterium]|nr:MAG: type II toxin-antitoxin system VapB family antitoxin [Deltaproteobacteria bacterium]
MNRSTILIDEELIRRAMAVMDIKTTEKAIEIGLGELKFGIDR